MDGRAAGCVAGHVVADGLAVMIKVPGGRGDRLALLAERERVHIVLSCEQWFGFFHGLGEIRDRHPQPSPHALNDATQRVPKVGKFSEQVRGESPERRTAGRTCRPDMPAVHVPALDRAVPLGPCGARAVPAVRASGGVYRRRGEDESTVAQRRLELGDPDDDRIDRAMAALDDVPQLDGWSRFRDPEDRRADRLPARLSSLDGRGQVYGVAKLAQGPRTVCVASALREDDGAGPDWLKLGFPMGALARVLADVGVHPYRGDRRDPSAPWRRSLDDWLADVGRTVYAAAPFRLGLIGFEVGGLLPLNPAYRDPTATRPVGLLVPAGDSLTYLPASD